MDAAGAPVSVRWWANGAFDAAPVPAHAAARSVGVRGQPDRATARRTIRAALLADLAHATGLHLARIRLGGAPGEAPYALIDATRIPIAISHDGDLSVAAWRPDGGRVGIDLMRVADVPDWQAVARDYLGPACAAALAGTPAQARPAAFARAWSAREARLKCLGLPLTEWRAEDDARLDTCRCLPLAVPEDYVGTLALAPG
jgi:4'-phosphopantetheinyl transferase